MTAKKDSKKIWPERIPRICSERIAREDRQKGQPKKSSQEMIARKDNLKG